ncbi:MAG: pirin family protein [Planctomycetota bacterium]
MIQIRRAAERGATATAWLDSRHTFSFADYHDPDFVSFRTLRVMNDDRIAPGAGFPPHGHRDMEIITYVLSGALEHKDSIGGAVESGRGELVRAGELQRMTAGTGIVHSEYNASKTEPVHLYQIWITPDLRALKPSYQQITINKPASGTGILLAASRDGHSGSLTIHQDAELYIATIKCGAKLTFDSGIGRSVWIQTARGKVTIGDASLEEGDGASTVMSEPLRFSAAADAELLIFSLV